MCQHDLQISLGFSDQKVPVGTHMCLIFTKDEEFDPYFTTKEIGKGKCFQNCVPCCKRGKIKKQIRN